MMSALEQYAYVCVRGRRDCQSIYVIGTIDIELCGLKRVRTDNRDRVLIGGRFSEEL